MMQYAAIRHRYPEQITDMRGFYGFDNPVHFKTEDEAWDFIIKKKAQPKFRQYDIINEGED
jgi:ABC-type microcin C transport system permease subunit YejB